MSQTELDFHRKIAKQCFNEAWNCLDKYHGDAYDEQQMLHLAHASRFHWGFIENRSNMAVGDWQISRIYASLNQSYLAILFARSALDVCEKNNLSDILHTAYEGMARAYAAAKDYQSAREYITKARDQLSKATGLDDEDKKIYSDQIDETQALIGN